MASRPQRFEMALQLCFFVADTCHTLPLLLFLGMAAKKLSSIFVKHSQLQPSCSPAAICSSIHSFECLHHHLLPGCASVCVPQCVSVWQDCAGWCCLAALQFAIKVNLQLQQLQQGACSSCNLIHRLDSTPPATTATSTPGPSDDSHDVVPTPLLGAPANTLFQLGHVCGFRSKAFRPR